MAAQQELGLLPFGWAGIGADHPAHSYITGTLGFSGDKFVKFYFRFRTFKSSSMPNDFRVGVAVLV